MKRRIGLGVLLSGFEPAMERLYNAELAAKARITGRAMAVLAPAIYLGFGFFDKFLPASDVEELWRVRLGIIVPGFALMLVISFIQPFWRFYQQLTSVLLVATIGGAHFAFTMTSHYHVEHNLLSSSFLVILGLYTAARLNFPWAVLTGVGFTALQMLAMAWSPLTFQRNVDTNFFLVAVNVLGAMIAAQMERDRRHDFLLRGELAHAQATATIRNAIMERFLAEHVRSRFTPDLSLEENLERFLVPRPTRVGLLQADIRGFSRLASQLPPISVVALLQRYYRRLVDAAQKVGQVKVVGDALFVFVEGGDARDDAELARTIVGLAQLLVEETTKLNLQSPTAEGSVKFGIAVHLGDAIVGNLSSENCIDYTAVGTEVNKVARLEELTKHPVVAESLGVNGILLSEAVAQALGCPDCAERVLDLKARGMSLRSFPGESRVHYLPADAHCRLHGLREAPRAA